jgi:hypothetical protein
VAYWRLEGLLALCPSRFLPHGETDNYDFSSCGILLLIQEPEE